MSAVVGIDLGTTNTVVGAVMDGHAVTLADSNGSHLIPSAVAFPPGGHVLVGGAARERRLQDAANTVFSVKRLIGRSWGSPEVELARSRFPFEMREGPGLATLVAARGQSYTLPEISAFVLRKAKSVAEEALGEAVERAVITVPASFNDLQRAATKVAGRVAGLDVLRILNEPTAAALAYGYGKGHSERIAVYDFGGGTFDVTLIDLSGNVFEVLSTAGDSFLGGDDIDDAIADVMAKSFLARHRYDARTSVEAFDQLRLAAEDLKMRLGNTDSASTTLHGLAFGAAGKSLDATFTLTRPELERLAEPVIERSFNVCREALQIAGLGVGDFDQVLLVGGSTRIPLVQQRVAEFFGRAPQMHANPDEVVALGAAIQASALTASRRRQPRIPAPPAPSLVAPQARQAQRTLLGAGPPSRAPLPAAPLAALAPPSADREAVRRTPGLPRSPLLDRTEATQSLAQEDARVPPPPPSRARSFGPATDRNTSEAARATSAQQEAWQATPDISREGPEPALELDEEALLPVPSAPPYSARPGARAGLELDPDVPLPPATSASPPLLIDVTPLSLAVETVGGYCDVLVERNSKVPCAQARVFVTSSDNQHTVAVRVCQGESRRFDENTHLGEVVLDGLRDARRGEVEVEIRFALDPSGMLGVKATDLGTQREASVRLQLVGITDPAALDALAQRHAMRQIR